MIYRIPASESAIDQGDILDGCPVVSITAFVPGQGEPKAQFSRQRVVVLTQTCDLANEKTTHAVVAVVLEAASLVGQGVLKAADVRGPLRAGRVWGWYFLPAFAEGGLPEMIVDLRQLHTFRREHLMELCNAGQRRASIQPLYREHLAKHFADTYSRIGLPQPYETL